MKNLYTNLSLKFKILSFVVAALLFLVVVGFIGYNSLTKSIEAEEKLTKVEYPKVNLVQRLKSDNHAIVRFLWSIHGLYNYAAERKNQIEESKKTFKSLVADIEELNRIKFDDKSSKNVKEINARWKDLKESIPKVIATFEKGNEAADKEASMSLAMEIVPLTNEIYDVLNEFDKNIQSDINNEVATHSKIANNLKNIIVGSLIMAFVFLNIIGIFVASRLSTLLLGVANNISQNASSLLHVAQNVAVGSKTLTDDTNKQATAMTETSSAVHELNSMISKNSENASKSFSISDTSKKDLVESQKILSKVIVAINEVDQGNEDVSDQVKKNNEKLNDIVKIILEINSKTTVINDIVFQIKLLSFNASVEAARAGEHGKGFAVVAEEVGNLAQSTARAAQDISDLLNSSVEQVKTIAKETSDQINKLVMTNKNKVQGCVELSKECDIFLNEVVKGSSEVNRMVQEISISSTEQSTGMEEISKAMNQLSDIFANTQKLTSDNKDSVSILYNEIESLKSEVESLNKVVLGN
jgi:methyl-accepting chemotaxis protein